MQRAKDVQVKVAQTEQEMEGARAVRRRVFIEEQGVPAEEEYDEHDGAAVHVVAVHDGAVIGTGRVFAQERGEARIGRMAVDLLWRRARVGSRLLTALEQEARRLGLGRAVLHAQKYVHAFYLGHGYAPEGPTFMEAGIEHVTMKKLL